MRKILLATTFVAGSLIAFSNANAIVATRNATVQIVTPLSVSAGTNVAFGQIQKPTTATSVVRLTAAGVSSVTSGDAVILGTPATGSYTISGDATNTVSISVASTSTANGLAIAFPAGSLTYNGSAFTSGTAGLAAPSTGKTLVVGGDLTITTANTVTGSVNVPFDITVIYQ